MTDLNLGYDPEEYWSTVARHIRERNLPSMLAGDDEPFDRLNHDKFVEQMLQQLPIANRKCLEVGCGPGGNLLVLRRLEPARLVGVDISGDMVDLARECGRRCRGPEDRR